MSTRLTIISRQLGRFVGVSLFLSILILACSLVFLGNTSFWLSEAGFLFTIIHHSIILHNQRKHKDINRLHSESSPIPVSSRKPTIFVAWFIAVVYAAALGIVIFILSLMVMEGWEVRFTATAFELVFLVLEIPLMVVIALWCMRERRAVLGAPNHAKWYHLPQYQS